MAQNGRRPNKTSRSAHCLKQSNDDTQGNFRFSLIADYQGESKPIHRNG